MAVYKATYCYPLLNSLDVRIAATQTVLTPAEFLKCKIDSSNKRVTGYKIRILDSLNNQIFPSGGEGYISPIQELEGIVDSSDEYLNSGWNGSMLNIPFFQNYNYNPDDPSLSNTLLPSYNAVYYKPKYIAQYVIQGSGAEGPDLITNWQLDNGNLVYSGWDGTLNGEIVLENEIVFAIPSSGDDTDKGGLWQVTSTGMLKRYKDYNNINIDYSALYNQQITITHGSFHNTTYGVDSSGVITEYTGALWIDMQGNPINLSIDGGSYKWEITLYQGEPVIQGVWLKYADYSSLNYEWFDSVLTSGTILGSTNKRIQLASGTGNDAILPQGTTNSPLVLQGTYIQLYDSFGQQVGPRAYVQSYDATYGHVYPASGQISEENIRYAATAKFFKHSNNPDDILATDRVTVATTGLIEGLWDPTTNKIQHPNITEIDGHTLVNGDTVLVKNQGDTNASKGRENGVYIVSTEGEWHRSGSYNTWAKFMGAVIYVEQGQNNVGKNFECDAASFGTLYGEFNPDSDSVLVFKEEEPITIFPDLQDTTVQGVISSTTISPNVDHGSADVVTNIPDSIPLTESMVGLNYYVGEQKRIIKITYFYDDDDTFDWQEVNFPNLSNKYIGVATGQVYGSTTVQVPSNSDPLSPSNIVEVTKTATVLKNDVGVTYISPYINLEPKMALKLQDNKTVEYFDHSVSNWIRINSVNKTLWRITHKNLANALKSFDSLDTSIPYTYEVRTYFKTSDENPFYLYETPYLKLNKSGITTWEIYQVTNGSSSEEYDVTYEGEQIPFLVQQPLLNVITERYVTLQGYYVQFQQSSWESYRWVLYDYYGNILQDTGLKYDKLMTVTFYGLSNETTNKANRYYAILYVTDDLGNNLMFSVQLTVDPNSIKKTDIEFVANLDCDTHSILLNYQDNVLVAPSNRINAGTSVKVEPDGKTYNVTNGTLYLSDDALYDVPLTQFGTTGSEALSTGLSDNVKRGMDYTHYYLVGQDETREGEQYLTVKDNSLYLETEVALDDNYCGSVLEVNSEALSTQSFSIQIILPDNFEGGHKVSDLSGNRTNFYINVSVDDILTRSINTGIEAFSGNFTKKYILQPQSANNSITAAEYHEFEVLSTDGGTYGTLFYVPIIQNGKIVKYLNSQKDLGSCCVTYNQHAGDEETFWREDIGTIVYYHGVLANGNGINMRSTNLETIPYWPDSDETNRFWVDDFMGSTDLPANILTSPLTEAKGHFEEYRPYARHIGQLQGVHWRITVDVPDIDNFYQYVPSADYSITVPDSEITFTYSGTNIASIKIQKLD